MYRYIHVAVSAGLLSWYIYFKGLSKFHCYMQEILPIGFLNIHYHLFSRLLYSTREEQDRSEGAPFFRPVTIKMNYN